MQLRFNQTYLQDLFEEGKTSDKHHRFQPQVVKGYQKALRLLQTADRVEDLFHFHALNYEVLSGDKKGISSVRANGKYRVEFIVEKEEEGTIIISICNILDLSNHYQ